MSPLPFEFSACSLNFALIFSIGVSSSFFMFCFELISYKNLYRCEFGVLKICMGKVAWNFLRGASTNSGQLHAITIDLT